MLLEHLTLGEKVDSGEAVDLPVKLAIALLKDGDGRINIKLPVTGDLNNPQFELGPVIRMALFNMLTNIISAPFDFLASLVGGDASEMQVVAFNKGHDAVGVQQQASLATLVTALKDRPELDLEVTGTASKKEDWPYIASGLFDAEWKAVTKDLSKDVSISEEESLVLLKRIASKQKIELAENIKDEDVRQTILTSWPYDEGALRALAIRRAKGIKDYLTEKGLEAERVFILDVQTPAESLADSAVESKLELTSG